MHSKKVFTAFQSKINGTIVTDNLHKSIYATDASVYRKLPQAIVFPKEENDIKETVLFARKNHLSITPRTAGTSLAGQCVTDGIVLDVSKHFTKIIALNTENKTITVQPGVIRDDLNRFLKPHGLFFGPNTSTSNRCMIGGMVGNNSSGTTSIQYGVTRDKVISLKTILSDGSSTIFKEITNEEFVQKTKLNNLEGAIYKKIFQELSDVQQQQELQDKFPKPEIHRRNTGYAVDSLLKSSLFGGTEPTINVAKMVCGSEGTLAISTEITLQLDNLPPQFNTMVCAHFENLQESLEAVVIAMKHNLYTCELMDKIILDCTKNNLEQQKNRFFLKGDPAAILMLEVAADSKENCEQQANALIEDLVKNSFGYRHPKVKGSDITKVHNLRKAGLGLLGNIVGDKKAVACIEDTAVLVKDLPQYISEFTEMMKKFDQEAVYYAHAGAGEIHLRPILNLKKNQDVTLFREITTQTALLVKKYNGSFSGEHGDGIVRSEFIPLMIGKTNYEILKRIKEAFDPNYILNKGKIIAPLAMDKNLRYEVNRKEPEINTFLNFDDNLGILRLAEKCNGSGDCRKSAEAGGTMCPSYRATKDEKNTTRARANALRELLTTSKKNNKFNHRELKEVFDLCVSCKGCTSECPSNVDVSVLKAEFLHQYYKENKIPLRTRIFANIPKLNKIGSKFPGLTNSISNTKLFKTLLGIAPSRALPRLQKQTLFDYYNTHKNRLYSENESLEKIVLFCDEFTNYYDVKTGIATLELLYTIGIKTLIVDNEESGRSALSKGLLKIAKNAAQKNIQLYQKIIREDVPLVGIEPSAILSFRDEYLRISDSISSAQKIAKNTYTIEEYLYKCIEKGYLKSSLFTNDNKTVKIHGHCHQKALSSTHPTFQILNLPVNYRVTILNTGCCGMAGSFGYEKEHYQTSMQIGEDTLFPKIKNTDLQTIIAASGTSCRHQIKDGVSKESFHPVEILYNALLEAK